MKDIPGFEGLYAVTTCGRVWSYKNKKFLKSFNRGDGYYAVNLYKNDSYITKRIHRLVAEAYLPNPNNLPCVNHKDENKEHNYINNLEWCDTKYNNNYGTRIERVAKSKSKQIYCSDNDTHYDSAKEAAASLGIPVCRITATARGEQLLTHGLHFCYIK